MKQFQWKNKHKKGYSLLLYIINSAISFIITISLMPADQVSSLANLAFGFNGLGFKGKFAKAIMLMRKM